MKFISNLTVPPFLYNKSRPASFLSHLPQILDSREQAGIFIIERLIA